MTKTSDAQLIADLKATIAEQQEEIWQLQRALGFGLGFKVNLGLSRTEMRLFLVMAKDGSMTVERGEAVLASDRTSMDINNLLRIHMHNMRQKLKANGIEVKNQHGICYYLDAETLARVRPMILEDRSNGLEATAHNPGQDTRANGHSHA